MKRCSREQVAVTDGDIRLLGQVSQCQVVGGHVRAVGGWVKDVKGEKGEKKGYFSAGRHTQLSIFELRFCKDVDETQQLSKPAQQLKGPQECLTRWWSKSGR